MSPILLYSIGLFDKRYDYSHTQDMKTAISIPDALFHLAEKFAHERGLSRSELYTKALHMDLNTHRYQGITDALNKYTVKSLVHSTLPS